MSSDDFLDPYDDFEDMRPEPILPPGRVKAVSIGVPIDTAKHPNLYKRPVIGPRATGLEVPPKPRVHMADPPPGSVPSEAQKSADALSGAGFEVRLTYGVCGHDHVEPERGKCAVCEYVGTLSVEGGLPKHVDPMKNCSGAGSDPTKIVMVEEKGKTKRQGVCSVCNELVRLTRTDKIFKHGPTCLGVGAAPEERIPGKPLPPEESLAVRVRGFGAACWVNGKYDLGGVVEGRQIVIVGVREWQRRVKQAVAGGGASA